jgi:polysaccharide export outer membrane protein
MRCLSVSLLAIAVASTALAQQQDSSRSVGATTSFSDSSNLPVERLGREDLLGITVYDSPELTRTVRVDADGSIRLPMLQKHIPAAGLLPSELENAIASALTEENLLVDPIVTVTVVEYRSRPITVLGAVRNPLTFQATGNVTLLDAISKAGGISENAGADILVTHSPPINGDKSILLSERISVRYLLDASDPASNIKLEGGDTIRVPEAGQVFVVGNVKHPGAFVIRNGAESSVLKALSLSDGLDSYASHTAYIYRVDDSTGHKKEIPVDLKKILSRKSPDVPLFPNDMLYIPNAEGRQATAKALAIAAGVGLGVTGLVIYATR